jgi:hypothetical protein
MAGSGETTAVPTTFSEQVVEWGRALVPSVAGAIGFTGFVSLAGAAVVWMRFSTAGLPADQSVHDLPLSEWVATGAVSLTLYLGLGLAAVLLVYLLQEAAIESMIDDGAERKEQLQLELALQRKRAKELEEEVVQLGAVPVAVAGQGGVQALEKAASEHKTSEAAAKALEERLFKVEQRDINSSRWGSRWGTLVLCASELIVVTLRTDIATAWKVSFAILTLAIAVLVVLGTIFFAKNLRRRLAFGIACLAMLAFIAVVLVLEQKWTFVPVLAALLFALANLAIGRLHPRSFLWYGIAIFASVGVFGVVLTYSRDVNAPSAQPAAVLLKNGCAVRGLWVGESSSRVFLARISTPSEAPESNLPLNPAVKLETGRVFWVDRSNVASESVGKLTRVPLAEDEAGELRGEVLALDTGARLTEKQCAGASDDPPASK